jgi:hypothetical protein
MKIQNHFAGNPFSVKKFNFFGAILCVLVMLLFRISFSQNADSNKILTVTYCIALESNDTTEYIGYYRSTFENELRNTLLAMGNLHVISPEPAGIFDSVALRFMKVIDNDSTQRKVSNSKQFLSQYSKYANLDGVVFVSSTKIPIISPAHTGPRAVFILRSFLINFENDSIYFFKRRLAIGNEWTILNSDLSKLFLDTIRSDYHESPRSEMEKRSVNVFADGSPGPSLTSVPDIFDSVFSKAMSNQDTNSITKYYNENISYNVYSVNECPEISKGCDSCRSFYILNYLPLDRKPNQLYNKRNFLKSACLLEYFFSRDTLNAISYPSNLYKTTFLAGITDFYHGDSITKKYNVTYERPFYLWAINLSEQKKGLQRQSVDTWVDESLNLPSFYSDIYKLSNQKPSSKKYLLTIIIILIAIVSIDFVYVIFASHRSRAKEKEDNLIQKSNDLKSTLVELSMIDDEFRYILTIHGNEYKLPKLLRCEYLCNLINHKSREIGVDPDEIQKRDDNKVGIQGNSKPMFTDEDGLSVSDEFPEDILEMTSEEVVQCVIKRIKEIDTKLRNINDIDKARSLEKQKKMCIKYLNENTHDGKIKFEKTSKSKQLDNLKKQIVRVGKDKPETNLSKILEKCVVRENGKIAFRLKNYKSELSNI